MEACIIPINLETEKDVYFAMTCNILSYNKKKEFVEEDIITELKETYNWNEEVFEKWPIRKMLEICLVNLREHGKVIEEPRCWVLANI